MTRAQVDHILQLPYEILEYILCHCRDLGVLIKTCKKLNQISKTPSFRVRWLAARFAGRKNALLGCVLCYSKLLQDDSIGIETLKLLLHLPEGSIPRYILQKTFKRLTALNLPYHIVKLLEYGTSVYKDLRLNARLDDQEEFIHTIDSLLDSLGSTDSTEITRRQKILNRIKKDVETGNFDINYPSFGSHKLWSRSGDLLFHTSMYRNKKDVFHMFLDIGKTLSNSYKKPVNLPTVQQVYEYLQGYEDHSIGRQGGSVKKFKFISREYNKKYFTYSSETLYRYMPVTEDAIIFAVYWKRNSMVTKLLEAKTWTSQWDQCILCSCIQIAVDRDWKDGEDMLKRYFTALPGVEFMKSQFEFTRQLRNALNIKDSVATLQLLREGAKFNARLMAMGEYGALYKLIYFDRETDNALFTHIIQNYQFSHEMIKLLLKECIYLDSVQKAQEILDTQDPTFNPPSSLLADCVEYGSPKTLDVLIRRRQTVAPTQPEARFRMWMKKALEFEDTETFELLSNWSKSIEAARKRAGARSGGRNKTGKTNDNDDDEFQPYERKGDKVKHELQEGEGKCADTGSASDGHTTVFTENSTEGIVSMKYALRSRNGLVKRTYEEVSESSEEDLSHEEEEEEAKGEDVEDFRSMSDRDVTCATVSGSSSSTSSSVGAAPVGVRRSTRKRAKLSTDEVQ